MTFVSMKELPAVASPRRHTTMNSVRPRCQENHRSYSSDGAQRTAAVRLAGTTRSALIRTRGGLRKKLYTGAHRGCTGGAQRKKVVGLTNHALDPMAQVPDVEIDQKTGSETGQSEVCEEL